LGAPPPPPLVASLPPRASARVTRSRRSARAMPPKKKEPEPEPEAEEAPEPEPEPEPRALADILSDFLAAQADDPDAASAALAAELEIEAPTTDLRNGAKLDFLVNTALFSRDAGFSPSQMTFLHELALRLVAVCADPKADFQTAEGYFQRALIQRVTATPTEGCFTIDDVRVVSAHFTAGFFSHFKLYAWMYRNLQDVDQHETVLRVETPLPFPKLVDAYAKDSWEAKLVRDAEAAAEAERVRKEEEEAAAAEAERVRREEEEAERIRAEEELAKRRPKNLDEAVEHAVREKLRQEREALEAEYAAREEQLLLKIAALEEQIKG